MLQEARLRSRRRLSELQQVAQGQNLLPASKSSSIQNFGQK